MLKQYPMRKFVHISRHTITHSIKYFYQEKRNNVILDSDSIIHIYSYLFSQTNYIFDAKEFFNHIKLNCNYNRPLYNVLSNQYIVDFNHSNILDRKDGVLMKYESAEENIKLIDENEKILDKYDWDDFRYRYSFHHNNYTNELNDTIEVFVKLHHFFSSC